MLNRTSINHFPFRLIWLYEDLNVKFPKTYLVKVNVLYLVAIRFLATKLRIILLLSIVRLCLQTWAGKLTIAVGKTVWLPFSLYC